MRGDLAPLLHPQPASLAVFFSGLPEADAALLGHVLRCSPCRELVLTSLALRRGLGSIEAGDPARTDAGRLWNRLRGRRGAENRAALAARVKGSEAFLAALRALPADRQIAKVAELAKRQPWPVTIALVEAAKTAARDLAERQHLAQLAFAAAAEIPDEGGSSEAVAALQLEIQLEIARVARLLDDTGRADEAMAAASRLLGIALDPLAHAAFCGELARLRRSEQRFDEALALFERAASLFEDHDRTEEQAEAWLEKGELELFLFMPHAAVESFDLVVALLPEGGLESETVLRAFRGAASSLTAVGRVEEARRVLTSAPHELLRPIEDLVIRSMLARLRADGGDLDGAASERETIAQAMAGLGEARHTACAYVELARLRLVANRREEARAVARSLDLVLGSGRIAEPARAVLERFRLLLLAGTARPSTARTVADYLDRASHDPGLTLELPPPPGDAARS